FGDAVNARELAFLAVRRNDERLRATYDGTIGTKIGRRRRVLGTSPGVLGYAMDVGDPALLALGRRDERVRPVYDLAVGAEVRRRRGVLEASAGLLGHAMDVWHCAFLTVRTRYESARYQHEFVTQGYAVVALRDGDDKRASHEGIDSVVRVSLKVELRRQWAM